MIENLQSVRALIDAKIAAYKEEQSHRRETRWSCRSVAPMDLPKELSSRQKKLVDEWLEFHASQTPIKEAERVVSRCRRRLSDNLPVPPPESRPPNLHAANLSFAARIVIAVRDRFGGDAPRVYKAAGMTASAYSQIVSDETHVVQKRTAIRFAFALRMTPDEARQLLNSAGFAFSHSLTEDCVLEACLENNPPIYDFDDVNAILREYRVDYQY